MKQERTILALRGWKGYVLAVLLAGAALVVMLSLRSFLAASTYIIFVPAVVATAWFAGFRAALLGALFSVIAVEWGLRPLRPDGHLVAGLVALATLAGVSGLVAWLAHHVRKLVRVREEILAIVAHDLRNALHVVLTSTHALRGGIHGREDRERLLEIQERAIARANRLMDDLRDAASMDKGQFRVEPQATRVEDLLTEARDQIGLQNGVQCVLHLVPGFPPISVDRCRMVQALTNLLENAARHSPDGGTVVLGAVREAQHLVLYVSDEGHGISERDLPYVFQSFWRGEDSSGSGLGLAIVKGITEAHGGSVQVESQQGQGATFRLLLPLSVEGTQPTEPAAQSGADETRAQPYPAYRPGRAGSESSVA